MWVLSKLVTALKDRASMPSGRQRIRYLSFEKLQNFPAWDMSSFDQATDISFLTDSLSKLDLAFIDENNVGVDLHADSDWDSGRVRRCNLTPYLRDTWLRPTANHLTSLSISSAEPWGSLLGYFNGKGLAFPQLQSLKLDNYIISHTDQLDWVLRQKSLKTLYLVDTAILSYVCYGGSLAEHAEVLKHDWIELGDDRYYFPGTWEALFNRIHKELACLTYIDFSPDTGGYYGEVGAIGVGR